MFYGYISHAKSMILGAPGAPGITASCGDSIAGASTSPVPRPPTAASRSPGKAKQAVIVVTTLDISEICIYNLYIYI